MQFTPFFPFQSNHYPESGVYHSHAYLILLLCTMNPQQLLAFLYVFKFYRNGNILHTSFCRFYYLHVFALFVFFGRSQHGKVRQARTLGELARHYGFFT